VYALFSGFIRLLLLGYGALAVFAFFEIRALLRNSKSIDSFQIDHGTLYVPMLLCFPSKLEVDGITLIDSINVTSHAYVEGVQCRQLDYIMIACASSLLFAAASCVLFVFCDFMARIVCCPFDLNSSSGMAIFVSFMLIQAGISVGALAEQNRFWVQHFKDIVYKLDVGLDVESYAHYFFLIGTALSSFGIAFLVIIDATCSRCCHHKETASRGEEEVDNAKSGILGWARKARTIEGDEKQAENGNYSFRTEDPREESSSITTSRSNNGHFTTPMPPWSEV